MPSTYANRRLIFPVDVLTHSQLNRIRTSCYGMTIGNNLFIHEVFWQEAYRILAKGGNTPALKGIEEMLVSGNTPPGVGWEGQRSWLKDYPLTSGSKLRAYQAQGTSAIIDKDILLTDDMGTGKTLQILAARIGIMREQNKGWRMIVLVPSAEVASSWRRIAHQHFGQVIWHIEDRTDFNKKFMQATGIWVCMYSKFWRDGYLEHLRYQLSLGHGILVCDEFHRCAGADTKQYFYCNELRELAYRFVGATGTSVPNRPDSYHSMYTITNKQSTLQLEYWNAYFSRGLTDAAGKTPNWDIDRLKSIYALRGTYSLRRLKSEVADLPPLTGPIPIVCPMPAAMRKHYVDLHNQNKTEFANELGDGMDEVSIGHFYTKHLRLYQCSTLPSLLGITGPGAEPTHKLNRLLGLLEEAGDQKVLIWCNFPTCIEWLAEKIRQAIPRTITKTAHGSVSQADRSRLVDQFQEGLINYLVANPAVWGEGITLTAASVTIYWDLHPSRVRWRQSQDRAYRIGQQNPHTIYALLHEDSIDIHTLNWLGTKDMWADAIETGRGERQVNRVNIGNPYGKLKR